MKKVYRYDIIEINLVEAWWVALKDLPIHLVLVILMELVQLQEQDLVVIVLN